jgi:hypothetical protein
MQNNYPVKFNATLLDVKDIYNCSAFFSGQGYLEITPEIIDKINSGELVITEYHDEPLGEVIYLSAASKNN